MKLLNKLKIIGYIIISILLITTLILLKTVISPVFESGVNLSDSTSNNIVYDTVYVEVYDTIPIIKYDTVKIRIKPFVKVNIKQDTLNDIK